MDEEEQDSLDQIEDLQAVLDEQYDAELLVDSEPELT